MSSLRKNIKSGEHRKKSFGNPKVLLQGIQKYSLMNRKHVNILRRFANGL